MRPSDLDCDPFESETEDFRLPLHVVGLHVVDAEAGLLNEGGDVSGHMAAASHLLPRWLDASLPAGNAGVRCSTVLDEMEPATWLEDPTDLGEGGVKVGNGAKGPGRE